jgi:hypothetical protein
MPITKEMPKAIILETLYTYMHSHIGIKMLNVNQDGN